MKSLPPGVAERLLCDGFGLPYYETRSGSDGGAARKNGGRRMTDDEVAALLTKLSSQRCVAWQRNEPGVELPADASDGIESDIRAILWYIGAKPSRDDLTAAGATPEQIAAAMADKREYLK